MFVGFLIGMFVGSVLSGVALLLASGITSQRDDAPVPLFAIREGYRNEDGSLTEKGKRFSDAVSPLNTGSDHYVAPVNIAPHPPTEIPHQATIGPYPSCPTCGREADVLVKTAFSSRPIGFGCFDHGHIAGERGLRDLWRRDR